LRLNKERSVAGENAHFQKGSLYKAGSAVLRQDLAYQGGLPRLKWGAAGLNPFDPRLLS